jgi:hypothetical protein
MGEARGAKRLLSTSSQPGCDPSDRHALDPDIAALNLEPISYLIALEQPWSLEKLDAIELEYRCFLQLVRDRPDENIVPSRDCDIYWHAHILALGLYLEHCQQLFGAPLLHYPFSGQLGPEDAALQQARFRRCRRLHIDLMTRVLRTQTCDTTGEEHDHTSTAVPQSDRYPGVAQGA